MKKKVCFIFFILIVIVVGSLFLPTKQDYDYLRIHIRANSNSVVDQNVKYKIKDKVVEYLTPYFCNVPSKNKAINMVNNLNGSITNECSKVLKENGFNYSVNIKISNEYFPARTYENTTLDAGYYDAVIIELGQAAGDNWWCVMYPPLCFVNKNQNTMQIKYKSKIVEWFNYLFK